MMRLAIEAGSPLGWHKYVGTAGDILAVEQFGTSAPGEIVLREYGFTVENVCRRALTLLGRMKDNL
jgi:transketolase